MKRRSFLSVGANAAALSLAPSALSAAKALPKNELTALTLQEAAAHVRNGSVSPVELTRACLARIERYDTKIKAFITVTAERALAQARVAEQEIRQGRCRGPLHGIPIALKDNIDTAGIRTTAASALFEDSIPPQDAEVVRRLRQAGAVILGKLNMYEFAMSPEGAWGSVRSPWKLEYEAGGSSSGSAAALAAEFCFGTLGTDTGGSVRIPAHCCAVVGLKPTYGLVSHRGVIPLVTSLDHVGPLARSALDAALLLQGMAGRDPSWADSAQAPPSDYATALRQKVKPFGLGIPRAGCFERLDPEVEQLVEAALETMRTIGVIRNESVIVPRHLEIAQGVGAELCLRLAPLIENAAKRHSSILQNDAPVKSVLQMCTSHDHDNDQYARALQALRDARQRAAEIFPDGVDLLVLPTWKHLPRTIAERVKTWPSEEFIEAQASNVQPFNILGLPAISVPCGYAQNGLPVGVQIVGRPFAETQVLAFAQAYEQTTQWHSRRPKIS